MFALSIAGFFLALSAVAAPPAVVDSPNTPVPIVSQIGFDQRLGEHVPADLAFNDEQGGKLKLESLLGHGPVLVGLVYYGCPNLCTLAISGLFKGLQTLPFGPTEKYTVAFVSIDPSETPQLASEKKAAYLRQNPRLPGDASVRFLTGDQKQIQRLARAVGFRYQYDAATHQFAHPSGLTILAPDGTISRYLYGIEYAGKDLRLAMVEASAGKIGSPVDRFLLLCYHYDPVRGSYGLILLNILRALGILTIIGLAALIYGLLRWEKRRSLREVHP